MNDGGTQITQRDSVLRRTSTGSVCAACDIGPTGGTCSRCGSRWIVSGGKLQMASRRPAVIGTVLEVVQGGRIEMLKEDRGVLLRALRARLSPLRVKALDALVASYPGGMSSGMLAEQIGVSPQHGANLLASLLALGLVERKDIGSPHPDFTGPGRTPYWWQPVRAVREWTS